MIIPPVLAQMSTGGGQTTTPPPSMTYTPPPLGQSDVTAADVAVVFTRFLSDYFLPICAAVLTLVAVICVFNYVRTLIYSRF